MASAPAPDTPRSVAVVGARGAAGEPGCGRRPGPGPRALRRPSGNATGGRLHPRRGAAMLRALSWSTKVEAAFARPWSMLCAHRWLVCAGVACIPLHAAVTLWMPRLWGGVLDALRGRDAGDGAAAEGLA